MPVDFSSLDLGLQIAIIVVAVVELTLLVIAVVINLKTPQERLTLPRVGWLAISVLIGIVGPIAFLVAGRRAPQTTAPTPGASHATATSAIDELYQ